MCPRTTTASDYKPKRSQVRGTFFVVTYPTFTYTTLSSPVRPWPRYAGAPVADDDPLDKHTVTACPAYASRAWATALPLHGLPLTRPSSRQDRL